MRRIWPLLPVIALGGALGFAVALALVAVKGPDALCRGNLLCIATPLHGEPQQVRLSWTGDPDTTLTVAWVTGSRNNPGVVQYREAASETWSEARAAIAPIPRNGILPGEGFGHGATLTGLKPGATYEYRVSSDLGEKRGFSTTFTTRTAPGADGAYRFAFIADVGLRGRIDALADGVDAVLDAVRADKPLFVLGGGDYAYGNRDGRFRDPTLAIDEWFRQMQPLFASAPFMPAYGNHENRLRENLAFWTGRVRHPAGFEGTSYSFDVGPAHFAALFADGYNDLDGALAWLDRDLARARERGVRWLVVYQHEPVFGHGAAHPARPEALKIAGILERHRVDLNLSAHDQSYERTYQLTGAAKRPRIVSRDVAYAKGAGVVYAKVSPAGKRSEILSGFSTLSRMFRTSSRSPPTTRSTTRSWTCRLKRYRSAPSPSIRTGNAAR
jgi:hypothetical protein